MFEKEKFETLLKLEEFKKNSFDKESEVFWAIFIALVKQTSNNSELDFVINSMDYTDECWQNLS
jgi:hypothetical protein